MGRYRNVETRIWGDARVRALSWPEPCGLALFFRLLTGPETTIVPGLVVARRGGLAEALRWEIEGFDKAFAEVSAQGLAKADWDAGLVWLPKAVRHNPPQSPNVIKGWAKAWPDLPDSPLKDEVLRELRGHIEGMGQGFRKAFVQAFGEPSPNQEQEQEQEQTKQRAITTPLPAPSSSTGLRPVEPPAVVCVGEPEPDFDDDWPPPAETPHEARTEPAVDLTPEYTPAMEGAAARRLARHAAESQADDEKLLRYSQGRASFVPQGPRVHAPGPWRTPQVVADEVAVEIYETIPKYTKPSAPRLPRLPEGVAPCHEEDDDLAAAMLSAWKAVHVHKAGKVYGGNVGKRKTTIAEAARMLRAEGISAYVYVLFAWESEVQRTRIDPKFYTLCAPKAVGRYLQRCKRDANELRGRVVNGEKRAELLKLRELAKVALVQARPATAEAAREVIDQTLPRALFDELRSAVIEENAALAARDKLALGRGHWIW